MRGAGAIVLVALAACGAGESPTVAADLPRSVGSAPTAPPRAATRVDGQRVLVLRGDADRRGRDHGLALRAEILDIVDRYALDVVPAASFDAVVAGFAASARVPADLRAEAEGVVAGMVAAGGARSERLGRELTADDLLALTSMTDLLGLACSSLSVWGPATAADPVLRGAPAQIRNLDWSDDPELLAHQIVFVSIPDEPDRQPVMSVGFAGFLGCLTCMNAAGVGVTFNMGYGDGAGSAIDALGGFAPATLLVRDAIARRDVDGDGDADADDVEASIAAAAPIGSFILHVVEPRRPDRDPARVLEVEHLGWARREAQRHSALGAHALAATNHLRVRQRPTSCSRYASLGEAMATGAIDRPGLWAAAAAVALPEVVHTVLLEPEARRMTVRMRSPGLAMDAAPAPVVHDLAAMLAAAGVQPRP